ncbi:3',5'-cyclic adenosine monophosphate phosphodiesterase CpdA [Terrabacter aerolatus]|uniref:3',5'-cyclic adenosine monophosphate phosphodiesterase CpdA n=1 Tax=Terrabacter aerolatus TaxID=422442 RepID=A0A512D2Q2_9MICO|nr:metallophosphoesterase [Terrabacter aerolatus]GEO30724.1 3',5'-cyclic adenosine monophosphate phosphodiesterase CpdA [Terrabacter aerolatus]
MTLTGTRPAPTHVIAHLSDPHLLAGGGLLAGHIDTAAQLRRALARVEGSGERYAALVISGDLADTGDPDAYALLREIVDPVVARLGCALVLTGGNHDERRPMARELYGVDTDEPQDRVTDVDGLRIIALDSAVPGYHHGGFSDDQYAWLTRELTHPAPHGTILVIHHAPITYRSPVMQLLDFDDVERLRTVVEGSDVRAILSGHLHVTSFGTLGSVPVLVAGGVSYVDDVGAPRELLMAVDGPQSWNLVEVHADQVVATVVPIEAHETWPALSEAVMDFMATVPEADQREVFSRKRT